MAGVQEIVDLLPADGSPVTYDQWKESIAANGHHNLMLLTRTEAKNNNLVKFELVRDEAGNLVLQVRRNTGGGT